MIASACKILTGMMIVTALTLLPGCGYTLRGKIVRGSTSGVELVHVLDERLKAPGVDNVDVMVRRDPHTPNARLVGRGRSDASGEFAMRIGEFGAGWMQEQWLVQAHLAGCQNADTLVKLASTDRKWRLLITLAPGTATPLEQTEDYMQDLERFK